MMIIANLPVGSLIGSALSGIAGIGALVCAIMVLIPLFKAKGVGLGILGIICLLFTYIWGWMNHKELGLKKIMLIWTACIVVSMIGSGISTAAMASAAAQNPEAFGAPASGF